MTTYFVSRHPGALAWAEAKGIVIDHCTTRVENPGIKTIGPGDTVIGALPLHLSTTICAQGGTYLHLTVNAPAGAKGRCLSAEEMFRFGAYLQEYHVEVRSGRE